ncbi:MAG: Ig-like domain-containing protein [Acidobacteriota bacterium]
MHFLKKTFLCFFVVLAAGGIASAKGVRVEFNPQRSEIGPYPTDFQTVPDERQVTGLRVNRPGNPFFVYALDGELNRLDGFSINTRLSVKFSGAVRTGTLRQGIFFVWLDAVQGDRYHLRPAGHITPINEVTYDSTANRAHAKPDEPFEGARRYAIIVTDAVLDAAGDPVEEDEGFRACLDRKIGGAYCEQLSAAVFLAGGSFPPNHRIVGASVFTTLSATAFLEQARNVVLRTAPRFLRGTQGIIGIADINAGLLRAEVGPNGRTEDIPFPVSLSILPASGVRRVAVASFRTPRFLDEKGLLPDTPTAREPNPLGEDEIEMTVYLPATAMPAGGYPVLVAGHGFGDSRFGFPSALAIGQLSAGYAVVSINAYGHGYGAATKLVLTRTGGERLEIPARGRGIDRNGDGAIDSGEGCIQAAPEALVLTRDCVRQTAADLMQLLRVIREGVDLDGDGRPELNGARTYYIGQSLGAFYGTLLHAVEPELGAATLNVGGGSAVPTMLYGGERQAELRTLLEQLGFPEFEAGGGLPFRYEEVRVVSNPLQAAWQTFVADMEWVESPGAPASFAPHLKSATLPGVPVKRTLFQMARGDQTVPNPSNSLLIRAANMLEATSVYRHDLALAQVSSLPANPHAYLAGIGPLAATVVGFAAQGEAVQYMTGTSEEVPDVNPFVALFFRNPIFERPKAYYEDLGFTP